MRLLALLAAASAWAQTAPFTVPDNVEIQTVVYSHAGGVELKADLYLPKTGGPFPAVVYIHGGGWSSGDRTQLRRQAAHMTGKGAVGMAIEYRLAGQALFPAAVYDSKEAVRWLRASAARYRVDTSRIAAAGSSAGGHLAAFLGVTNGVAEFEGQGCCREQSSSVMAVVALNPVLDLTVMSHRDSMVTKFLGKSIAEAPELYRKASPLFQVTARAVPMLIAHGTADETVPYAQATAMVQKMKEFGVEVELFSAPGAPHTFWAQKQWYEQGLKAFEAFLIKQFGD
jgi:pectinesterase